MNEIRVVSRADQFTVDKFIDSDLNSTRHNDNGGGSTKNGTHVNHMSQGNQTSTGTSINIDHIGMFFFTWLWSRSSYVHRADIHATPRSHGATPTRLSHLLYPFFVSVSLCCCCYVFVCVFLCVSFCCAVSGRRVERQQGDAARKGTVEPTAITKTNKQTQRTTHKKKTATQQQQQQHTKRNNNNTTSQDTQPNPPLTHRRLRWCRPSCFSADCAASAQTPSPPSY